MYLLFTQRLLPALLMLGLWVNVANAQSNDWTPRDYALHHLRTKCADYQLTAADVADVRITDEYLSSHNGLTHVWVQQQHGGIPVFNALFGLHVRPNGEVITLGHRFEPALASKVNTKLPSLSAAMAVQMAMKHLGFEGFQRPDVLRKINEHNWEFEGGAISRTKIPVSICYEKMPDGNLRLAWTMTIDQANSSDYWSLRVDALNGEVIGKINLTSYCNLGHLHRPGDAECDHTSAAHQEDAAAAPENVPPGMMESYRVFALPTESPAHGQRTLVVAPADPVASPFGWHDTNGQAGAEFTVTRGNNVYAYDDADNNNLPPNTPAPPAQASLVFDFPFDPNAEPTVNRNAAVTNLFYMNNMIHDITYRFGFNEVAGNFQSNNYGKGGLGNDFVFAEALDGSGENNANFSTPVDGGNGRMQMYRWTRQGGKILNVVEPANIAGFYFANGTDNWGKIVDTIPVTGEVYEVNDGTNTPTLACDPLINDLTGKIALVDRTVCTFVEKALHSQAAGAIGCIICNFQEGTIAMGANANSGFENVKIPVVMIPKSVCDNIRQYANGKGLVVSLVQEKLPEGPNFLDGDFDNGIIAHEYGHGVSTRLTGGPSNSFCLGNAEQMGEGWSDWLTLMLTRKATDTKTTNRGVGTYVLRENNNGTGIRQYPYNTDMSVNPHTYKNVAEVTGIHAIGSIWTAMLWDLYWAMIEKYGFDETLTDKNSGNYRMVQLVIDGMKLQPCNPGFEDGFKAIMKADVVNYNGADTCLISSVFARRGLGWKASQGQSISSTDGVPNFDPIPYCIKELKLSKSTSTPLVKAGEEATFNFVLTNHKDEDAQNVRLTDELPAGLSFVSSTTPGVKVENGFVVWDAGTVPKNATRIMTYKAKVADNIGTNVYYKDPMESDADWISIVNKGNSIFVLQSAIKKSGNNAWACNNDPEESDYGIESATTITIQGNRPMFRFWHQFNTETGNDAGLFEIREVGATLWNRFNANDVVRNAYTGAVNYSTFAIPFLSGFSGNSNGFIQSYFDLSAWKGKTVELRLRFGSNAEVGNANSVAWVIDDLEQIDLVNANSEACVTDAAGSKVCASMTELGVVIDKGVVNTKTPEVNNLPLSVLPNPASDLLNVSVGQNLEGAVRISLLGADGRAVLQINRDNIIAGQVVTFDVSTVPAGMYLLRVESAAGNGVEKVVIR